MIKVLVYLNDESHQLAELQISRLETMDNNDGVYEYNVQIAVDRVSNVQYIQRTIWHRRDIYNVLGLLLEALESLDFDSLLLDDKIPANHNRSRESNQLIRQLLRGK